MIGLKELRFLLLIFIILALLCVAYYNKEKIDGYLEDDVENIYTTTPIEEYPTKNGREWEPVPVTGCVEIFKNQYHVTFENGTTILTNKPSKIGDTTKCWINVWYRSQSRESIDSVVFENPN